MTPRVTKPVPPSHCAPAPALPLPCPCGRRNEDALIPDGSLAKASMRAASIVTALLASPAPATDNPGNGHFWVLAAGLDKSVRRFRMCSSTGGGPGEGGGEDEVK